MKPAAPLSLTPEQIRLIEAQTAAQKAQAEFYRRQLADLRKPFWQKLIVKPSEAAGDVAAVVGASIAFVVLVLIFLSIRRDQKDTRFFEALKMLGDKDNPSARAAAVGMLTVMGKDPRYSSSACRQLEAMKKLEGNDAASALIEAGLREIRR